jgi:hypothetical protein
MAGYEPNPLELLFQKGVRYKTVIDVGCARWPLLHEPARLR